MFLISNCFLPRAYRKQKEAYPSHNPFLPWSKIPICYLYIQINIPYEFHLVKLQYKNVPSIFKLVSLPYDLDFLFFWWIRIPLLTEPCMHLCFYMLLVTCYHYILLVVGEKGVIISCSWQIIDENKISIQILTFCLLLSIKVFHSNQSSWCLWEEWNSVPSWNLLLDGDRFYISS